MSEPAPTTLEDIERLLAEPVGVAEARERREFSARLSGTDGSVVLFGAGRLGRLCARALGCGGVPLRAFCDGNAALAGRVVEGVEVLSLAEAARRFGETSLFVVAIWTGTARESMAARLDLLRALGCRFVTTYAPLVWAHGREDTPFHSFDLPSRVLAHADAFRELAILADDEASRATLLAALRQRLLGEFGETAPVADQYFPSDVVALRADEVVVDGGAYVGDTLAEFLRRGAGAFGRYHAFEPDESNRARLRAFVAARPEEERLRIEVHPVALHSSRARLNFVSHGQPNSHLEAGVDGAVEARMLDEELADVAVTFLKLDIEGAEPEALRGAAGLLARCRPLAAVCVYHGPDDLWSVPLRLHAAMPGHRLALRGHGFDGWEMVAYAVPPDRCVGRIKAAALRPCPVCESVGAREVLYRQRFAEGALGVGYDVAVCENCGAGFADGIPTQEVLDRYYGERSKYTYAHADGVESPYDFRRFEAIADQLEPHLPSKEARILDVGCATGGLLAVLKRRGYRNVVGSDPSVACAEAARRLHGIEVRTAALAQHGAWTDRFDAVLLVGVLEHLREAQAGVGAVAGLLAPGGVLYCAQPDVAAFADCANAPYQQFSTEHVNFFSKDSLGCLMAVHGLGPRATWRWMVEWREGMTDSVVSGVFQRSTAVEAGGRDATTRGALRDYLTNCAGQESAVRAQIDALVRSQEPLVVWGAGTLTRHLVVATSLGRANIAAFVDSNAALHGEQLAGRKIIAPGELVGRGETILICSRVYEVEIRRMIFSELKLTNRVRTFFVDAAASP